MTKATTPLVYNAVGFYAPGHARYNEVDLYDFLDIIGGYRLLCMCSHSVQASCDFLYRHLEVGRGKAISRRCKVCMEIVQFRCIAVPSLQPTYQNGTEPMQLRYRPCMEMVS